MLYRWWNEGKKRDSVMLFFSFGVLLCALGTIAQAYDINDANPMLVTVCLLPAFVTGLGAVATIVVNLAAREKTPYYKAPDPPPPLDLTQLTGDARAAVLKDRHKALESLRARGLLEGYDVDDLAPRPLGSLAADDKDADLSRRVRRTPPDRLSASLGANSAHSSMAGSISESLRRR